MKTLVRSSYVQVIGNIWQPGIGTCAYQYDLRDYDVRNITNDEGTITRDDVAEWLAKNAGDFEHVEDFSASIELGPDTIDIPWTSEESELTYWDCVSPCED